MTTQHKLPDAYVADVESRLLDECLHAACDVYVDASGNDDATFALDALERIAEAVGPSDPEHLGRFLIAVSFKVRFRIQQEIGTAEDREKCRQELANSRARLLEAMRRQRREA